MLPLKAPIRNFLRISHNHYPPLSTNLGSRLVVVKRPWFKRFITSFVVYGIAAHVWASLVLLPLEEEADSPPLANIEDDFSAEEKFSEEKDSSVFIPFGWPRQKPGELYSGSDPEWQKFVQISKNRELLKSLKDELAYLVRQSLSQVSDLKNITGIPLSTRSSWLIPTYPLRAPPSYELQGFKISWLNISWESKPIETEVGDRLRKVLLPTAAASALGAAITTSLINQYHNLKIYTDHKDGTNITTVQSKKAISQVHSAHAGEEENESSPANDKVGVPSSNVTASSEDRSPVSQSSRFLSSLQRFPYAGIAQGGPIQAAHFTLKQQLFRRGASPRTSKPGVFYMAGPISFAGPHGGCRAEVRGEYDPQERKWTEVKVSLIDAHRFKQGPPRR